MKKEDLMIGDWVNLNFDIDYKTGKSIYAPVQITGINKDGTVDVNLTYDRSESMQDGWDLKLIESIPLTRKILEKNGFILKEWADHKQYQYTFIEHGDELTIKIDYAEPYFVIRCLRIGITINFVHELQHALKFCKIKKEIVL